MKHKIPVSYLRKHYKYTVRRPISNDPLLRREGMVVSSHHTLSGAEKSLQRQQQGSRQQGGYSQDYIWDEEKDQEVSILT